MPVIVSETMRSEGAPVNFIFYQSGNDSITLRIVIYFWPFFSTMPFLVDKTDRVGLVVLLINCTLVSILADYSHKKREEATKVKCYIPDLVILSGFTGKMPEAAYHTLINTDLFRRTVFHDMLYHILSLTRRGINSLLTDRLYR
jgi:hypothetical protein